MVDYPSSIFAFLLRNAHSLPTAVGALLVPGRTAWHERCTSKPGATSSPLLSSLVPSVSPSLSLSVCYSYCLPLSNRQPFLISHSLFLSLFPLPLHLSLVVSSFAMMRHPHTQNVAYLHTLSSHLLRALLTFLRGSSDLRFVSERMSSRRTIDRHIRSQMSIAYLQRTTT